MLYTILCYHDEGAVGALTQEEDAALMAELAVVRRQLGAEGKLGPVARLMPTTAATTLREGREPHGHRRPVRRDQGAAAGLLRRRLREPRGGPRGGAPPVAPRAAAGLRSALEVRPIARVSPGGRHAVSDLGWIDAALTAARPQALGALLRYFRDLDTAEEAFQEACLRALRHWPVNGPPRDPAAWLILVGRNVALDEVRRRSRQQELPDEELISDLEDAEAALAERLDGSDYRDDVLRLLFICCHPELPATQQIALALRIVSGLSVKEIARAFLVSESAMEQRITRAKRRVAQAEVPFETPGPVERAERLAAVAAMIYLVFNEGYAASGGEAHIRLALCDEAIRLARLLLRLFPGEPEIMGLAALMLLQHARAPARLDAEGAIVLLEDQDRGRWNRALIAEGLALVEKAMAPPPPRALSAAGGDRRAARPRRAPGGDRLGGDRPAVRAARDAAALAGGHPQPRGRRRQAARAGGGARHGRAARRAPCGLLPLLRRAGRAAQGARPRRGGPRRLRPGDRARPDAGGSRPHPAPSRSPG